MVLSGIRPSFPSLSRSTGQITHVLLTRSPLEHPHQKSGGLSVRLACVKHAASVRPEPGSNSPKKQTKKLTGKKQRNQQNKNKQTPTTINNYWYSHSCSCSCSCTNKVCFIKWHTIEFSNNTGILPLLTFRSHKRKATLVSLANKHKTCQLRWSSAWRPPRWLTQIYTHNQNNYKRTAQKHIFFNLDIKRTTLTP